MADTLTFRSLGMTKAGRLAVLAAALGLGACSGSDLTVANFNNPDVQATSRDPSAVQFAVTGVLATHRGAHPTYLRDVGIVGRELLFFQLQDGRWVTSYLRDWRDPNSFFAGGAAGWSTRYFNRRNLFNLRTLVDSSPALSDAQRSALRGFANTFDALEMLYVIQNKDTLGAPTAIAADPTEFQVFVSRDSVYRFITATLDAGQALLAGGGGSFGASLTSGFSLFNTPATMVNFNRAIKARTEVYRGSISRLPNSGITGCGSNGVTCYGAALTALSSLPTSWLPAVGAAVTRADLDRGALNIYSTAAGDAVNSISRAAENRLFAFPTFVSDNPTDPRVTSKTESAPPQSLAGSVSSGFRNRVYAGQDTPTPIIRAEELILLRAEASYFTGATGNALTDINTIRTFYGLAARGAFADDNDFITELLTQRRLSLFFEGHRWVDVRRFGRLNTLPGGNPDNTWTPATVQVVPQAECLVRGQAATAQNRPELRGRGCP
ncbi:MAG: RagB/SusD family nutrient uptake outer membrane protein [Gemmatimonadales bacterium]|nr:RagB/SusD family nutrient uptake outer membrane protein [Gemmatimonadales bacterium]